MCWPAPETEVGIVSLAWTIHSTSHHCNRDGVLLSVARHLSHLFSKLYKVFVLDP
jgi:hypothetical protein